MTITSRRKHPGGPLPTYGAKVNARHAQIVADSLAPLLAPDETVVFMGRIAKLTGMLAWLVITTDRILGVRVNPDIAIEIDLDLTEVSNFAVRGLIPSLRITAGGDTYDFGHMASVKDCKLISTLFAEQQPSATATEATPASAGSASSIEDLRALTELHTSGALTDNEFAEAKRAILARMASS